eukprot:TRINITY_DN10375_c0_g1_i1.p1 TRINITY_DN10375_c0_g1~~TRINITY_DN10375_c0_g1_i1.p1  ORF type:complete len:860 (-),score=180.28 TRINITY_DN10375_c0_g1_i1:238-2817(-)
MPILSGLAAAGQYLLHPGAEFDGAALAGATFYAVRDNTVGQHFDRSLAAIDYKLERQKLHREDIRDLVELTTARMDIYHIVGTLLLAFCMGWYTENDVWALPVWFTDLFLITNFAAVGYLILCVWLAMYAAIASRSIGTRLLTSYARLSLPTKEQLDNIKVPIFCNLRDSLKQKFKQTTDDPDMRQFVGQEVDEVECEDNQQHFRKFLHELPNWLVYDTWARVCMSFGMNQMLYALAFFSLGTLWPKSPFAAIMSYAAIHVLAAIVLELDVGDLHHTWEDHAALVAFSVGPSVCVLGLLWYQTVYPHHDESHIWPSLIVLFCFWAHAAWLWYLVTLFSTAGSKNGRFQPGTFANVLDWIKEVPHATVNVGPSHKSSYANVMATSKEDFLMKSAVKTSTHYNDHDEEVADAAPNHHHHVGQAGKFVDPSQSFHPAPGKFVDEEDDGPVKLPMRGPPAPSPDDDDPPFKAEINGGRLPGTWARPQVETDISQTLHLNSSRYLPIRMIRYFTLVTIAWWGLSGLIHAATIADRDFMWKDFFGSNHFEATAKLVLFPEPTHLFKVAGLHCSNAHIWISSPFSTYTMIQGAPHAASTLELIKDGRVASIMCGSNHCDVLSPPSNGREEWSLAALDAQGDGEEDMYRGSQSSLRLPTGWRLTDGVWTHCPAQQREGTVACTEGLIAAWDGEKVYVSALIWDTASNSWTSHTRYEVDPTLGVPEDASEQEVKFSEAVEEADHKMRGYKDVQALQLSAHGRELAILASGIVDVWDLSKGQLMKSIPLGEHGPHYVSMCHSGKTMFLARQAEEGPEVDTMYWPFDAQTPGASQQRVAEHPKQHHKHTRFLQHGKHNRHARMESDDPAQ